MIAPSAGAAAMIALETIAPLSDDPAVARTAAAA
jgi:hypothetical protein